MSKSKEELNKVKEDVEAVNEKLQELTPEELEQVNGGTEQKKPTPITGTPGATVTISKSGI